MTAVMDQMKETFVQKRLVPTSSLLVRGVGIASRIHGSGESLFNRALVG